MQHGYRRTRGSIQPSPAFTCLLVLGLLVAVVCARPTQGQSTPESNESLQRYEEEMRSRLEERRANIQQEIQAEIRRSVAPAAGAVNEQDSLALVALYNSTDGENWDDNDGWLTAPVTEWNGVTVSGKRVEELSLSLNHLSGPIPLVFTNLVSLELFHFNNTKLCEPSEPDFQAWLGGVENVQGTGVTCSETSGPVITSVEPSPVIGSNVDQPFTIHGSGFMPASKVTLRDKRTGEVFPNRQVSRQTSTAITINPTFTTEAATWTVEVINGGEESSGEFKFEVVSPAVVRYPSLTLSAASLAPGASLTITGRGFTAGEPVPLRITGPPGFETYSTMPAQAVTAPCRGALSPPVAGCCLWPVPAARAP